MVVYVRPPLPRQVFYDASGGVIDYGNRWRRQSPPDDSYSVVSNPQRYAPLHTIADALIEHLARRCAVTVSENPAFSADLVTRAFDGCRAVRVEPAAPDAAAITFVFTPFPGVLVHAGLLHDFPFPGCGCDACDESVEAVADELESLVLAVAAGGYSESVSRDSHWTSYKLKGPNSARAGSGAHSLPEERLRAAEQRLQHLPKGWQAWPQLAERESG